MESFVPIIAIGGGLAIGPVIVAIVMWFEYRKALLRNKERMAAIEKGIPLTISLTRTIRSGPAASAPFATASCSSSSVLGSPARST